MMDRIFRALAFALIDTAMVIGLLWLTHCVATEANLLRMCVGYVAGLGALHGWDSKS